MLFESCHGCGRRGSWGDSKRVKCGGGGQFWRGMAFRRPSGAGSSVDGFRWLTPPADIHRPSGPPIQGGTDGGADIGGSALKGRTVWGWGGVGWSEWREPGKKPWNGAQVW